MIKNFLTLLFFVGLFVFVVNAAAYIGYHTPKFKKGLEQHLLRNHQ